MSCKLFISYRRTQKAAVEAVHALLKAQGVTVWLDSADIAQLDNFPARILHGLADSHAVLVWWSRDYEGSTFCMQEFRLAWQLARQRPREEGLRVWIVNPVQDDASHIHAGDLATQNYLTPPPPGFEAAWAQARRADLTALATFGPLAPGGIQMTESDRYGTPLRSQKFVGRGAELMQVHSAMFPVRLDSNAAPITVQVNGIAGVGKSALASQYAESFASAYPGGIWWFKMGATAGDGINSVEQASTAWVRALEEALETQSPGLLAVVSRDGNDRALTPPEVRDRLARQLSAGDTPKPYLWLLDNFPAVQPGDLCQEVFSFLRAPTSAGRTLITCQSTLPLAASTTIALPPLPAADGETLLREYLAPESREKERQVVSELVTEVEGHPLALTLLGEYVATSPFGLTPVLEQVRELGALASVELIHDELNPVLGKLAPSVKAAIELSLQPLKDTARRLLALASVCAPHARIPLRLLATAFSASRDGARQADVGRPGDAFNPALSALVRASLFSLEADDRQAVTLSPLVAAVMLQTLRRAPQSERQAIAEALLSRLSRLDSDWTAFVDLRADAPHAQAALAALDSARAPALAGRTRALLALGVTRLQDASGHPVEALAAARHAAAIAKEYLDAEDPDHLRILVAVSSALAATGSLDAAAALQMTLLPMVQRVFGAMHEDALVVWSLLAATRYEQHRLTEAEQLQRELLAAVRHLPRERHAVVRAAMTGLAATLYKESERSQLNEARDLQEEVLRQLEGMSDATEVVNPETVVALHNLAATCLAQGKIDEATSLQTRALAQAEGIFGDNHATTRLARSTLADSLISQADYSRAIPLYQKALDDATTALGPDHPECLITMSRLIGATGANGDHETANALQEGFMAAVAPVLPAGHPDTLTAVEDLARALNDLGQPIAHLVPLLDQVLRARLRDLGEGHLETIHAFSNLALALKQAGEVAAAVAARRGALKAARTLHGHAEIRIREIYNAQFELILLLDDLGQTAVAREAEAEAVNDLKAYRRFLQMH